jgi:hypothetical protein
LMRRSRYCSRIILRIRSVTKISDLPLLGAVAPPNPSSSLSAKALGLAWSSHR